MYYTLACFWKSGGPESELSSIKLTHLNGNSIHRVQIGASQNAFPPLCGERHLFQSDYNAERKKKSMHLKMLKSWGKRSENKKQMRIRQTNQYLKFYI